MNVFVGMTKGQQDRRDYDARPEMDDGCPPSLPDEAYMDDRHMSAPTAGAQRRNSIAPQGPRKGLASALIPSEAIEAVTHRPYLIKGWLDGGALSVLYGESNVGKTFLALDICFHVAAGRDWHGSRTGAAGTVIYVAAEGGGGIKNRIAAMKKECPEMAAATEGRFLLLPIALDLHGDSDAEALIELAKQQAGPVSMIVIDTLARAMGDGDENTARDMGMLIASVDHIRAETGAHVMLVHHSGKDTSKGARGSGSLRGAADTEIEITRDGSVVVAEPRKQRDMAFSAAFAYELQGVFLGDDQDGDPVTSCVVSPLDEAPKKRVKISGQAKVALQAFGDALAAHGAVKSGEMFPPNRQCVSLDHWREFCDRHSLSSGESDSARRTAFMRAKTILQEKGAICVVDDFAWRTE